MNMPRTFLVFTIAFLGFLMATESPAQAATPRGESALESGPIVRRQLLHRSARLEIQPLAAFTMNDSFIRNTLAGANVNYHLNNVFALGFTGTYGALHSDTSLRKNVDLTLASESPANLNSLSYSKVNWAADVGLSYVPLLGKFSIMNRMITHYDFHIMGGLAVVNESGVSASGSGTIDPVLEGTRAGGMFGFGMRLFLTDMISLNYDVRSYVYQRAEVSRGVANPQLTPTMVMSLGVGIFLPSAVKISR